MKQFIKIVNSVLLIVSLLLLGSSCSTLNIKNIEKKLITKNPGSVAISISTTYLPAKTVWYYTADSIFVFNKTLNRNQIAQDKYGLDKSLHNSLFFKELVDVEALENDIYKHCGYVLDGDELTLTLAKDSKTIQKSFFIDIDRFVSASFDHDVLNTIKSDIITYSLWPLLKEYNKVKAHEVLWVIDGIAADMYDPLLSDDIDIICDSIPTMLQHYYPIFQQDCIKCFKTIMSIPNSCYDSDRNTLIVIQTNKKNWIRDFELNDVYTTKKKKIPLGYFASKTELDLKQFIEKEWKVKQIKSLQIHPDGKSILDKKGKPHQICLSIETE